MNVSDKTINHMLDVLNRLVEKDRNAIEALCVNRVACNELLANDKTAQISSKDGQFSVGMIGVINAICGVDENSCGPIAGLFDETGKLEKFARFKIDEPEQVE